jgi:translation initiation factor 2B subunit (eIF-2B alpha/beta/delta family)
VLQLGLRYAEGSIVGGTKRTLALMTTLKTVIDELVDEGSDAQLRTLLKQVVDKNVQFLVACRPLAVGMGNAIREFKNEIERFHKTSPNATFDFAKNHFKGICSAYVRGSTLPSVCFCNIWSGTRRRSAHWQWRASCSTPAARSTMAT